jgi:transposase
MMSGHFWLTNEQMERLRPFFPKSRGKPRVDDRRVLSGIIYIKKNGLHWNDAPSVYGPPKTLYNRFVRWSRMGVPSSCSWHLEKRVADVSAWVKPRS